MKVYVAGALAGAQDLEQVRQLYEHFADAIRLVGLIPYLPHHSTDPQQHQNLSPLSIFETDISHIRESAYVVMYFGEPSLGTGYELAKTIELGIPILALYEEGKKTSRLAVGAVENYHLGYLYTYRTISDAQSWITEMLRRLVKDTAFSQSSEISG